MRYKYGTYTVLKGYAKGTFSARKRYMNRLYGCKYGDGYFPLCNFPTAVCSSPLADLHFPENRFLPAPDF